MPNLLEETAGDIAADQLVGEMTAAEERDARAAFTMPAQVGDLSNGGRVGGVWLQPMSNGRPIAKGRAAARRAWTYNGSETTLPLAWNPDGTIHDGARRYMAKRYCLCCGIGGFRFAPGKPQICPNCAHNNCTVCNAGTDTTKVHHLENGKTIQGWIIRCFYLRKEDVPFPTRFYGSVDCFLESCIRRDGRGFKTEADMRLHARSRHRLEYQGWLESQTASQNNEVESLRRRLDAMITVQGQPIRAGRTEEQKEARNESLRKARAAKKARVERVA